jgi:hypothetical protein
MPSRRNPKEAAEVFPNHANEVLHGQSSDVAKKKKGRKKALAIRHKVILVSMNDINFLFEKVPVVAPNKSTPDAGDDFEASVKVSVKIIYTSTFTGIKNMQYNNVLHEKLKAYKMCTTTVPLFCRLELSHKLELCS